MGYKFSFLYETEDHGSDVFEIIESDIYRALDKWNSFKGKNAFKLIDIKFNGV